MGMGGIRSRSTHLYSAVKFHTHDRGSSAAYLQHLSQETLGPFLCSSGTPHGVASIRIIGLGGPKCPVRWTSTFYLSPYVRHETLYLSVDPGATPANLSQAAVVS